MKKNMLLTVFICLNMLLMAQQSVRPNQKAVEPKPVQSSEQLDFASEKKAPYYNGGKEAMYKFIHQNMKYPADAKEKGIQGDVVLKFFVTIDGSISNVEVVQGIFPSLDAEAIRVVKMMPKWVPGKYGEQNAGMKTSLIIGFHLTE